MQMHCIAGRGNTSSTRVEPKLREAVSSFLEKSLRSNVERRLYQQAFIVRGLASRNEAKENQECYSAKSGISEFADVVNKSTRLALTCQIRLPL